MRKYTFLMTLCFTLAAQAGLLFPYSRLALKDLDQMNKLVTGKIKESRAESGDKSMPLREALQAVFSRPNEDFLIEKILPPLKSELEDLNAWDHTVKALVKESIGALTNPKSFKPEAQVTYAIFLENLVSEFKPRVAEPLEHSILVQIRDAKIELTKEALSERRLRMMKEGSSPSDMAQVVIENYEQAQKDKAASAAAVESSDKSDKADKDKK